MNERQPEGNYVGNERRSSDSGQNLAVANIIHADTNGDSERQLQSQSPVGQRCLRLFKQTRLSVAERTTNPNGHYLAEYAEEADMSYFPLRVLVRIAYELRFWWIAVALNDTVRTCLAGGVLLFAALDDNPNTETITVTTRQDDVFDIFPRRQGFDFFTVEVNSTTNVTSINLDPFFNSVQNSNLFHLLNATMILVLFGLMTVLRKYGPCTYAEWRDARLSAEFFCVEGGEERVQDRADGSSLVLKPLVFIASVLPVWAFQPDMVALLGMNEWLYVPGNEAAANALGYTCIAMILTPVVLCCCAIFIAPMPCVGGCRD